MRPALRRLAAALLGVASATTVLVAPVTAQDGTLPPEETMPPAVCEILSAEEVSAAFGEPLTLIDGSGITCQFDTDYAAGRFMSLFTSLAEDTTRDELIGFLCAEPASPAPGASAIPCGLEVPVGPSTGSYIPEGFGTMLYVDVGDGDLLSLQLVGEPADGVDKLAALTTLGALAVPRVASVPVPAETEGPEGPTFAPDPELEALMPTEIGGQALTIESMRGAEAFEADGVPQQILDALAAQGKTLDDVSVATAYAFDADTMQLLLISALRVRGADMAAFEDAFISVFNDGQPPAEQTPAQIGGKDVTVIRQTAESTDDQLQYAYPRGDILWLVSAVEPALSEVFSRLP
jgi:hypothetical protein